MTLKDAVLEIGCDEIPSSYIAPALEQMRTFLAALLEEHRLAPKAILCYATPRRLTLAIEGLPEMQESIEMEVTGPPVAVAFDAKGVPTKAGEGFAKAQGVTLDALQRKSTPKGEVVSAIKKVKGRPTAEILAELFPQVIKKVRFPKVMHWGDGEFLFARPIRWILAIFSGEPVPFEVAGIQAGRVTYGLRVMKKGPLNVAQAVDYLSVLREAGVLADVEERLSKTRECVAEAARSRGALLIEDEDLLKDVNNLIESPEAVTGDFDLAYLTLPSEVIVTAMREHQKFFAMRAQDGALVPGFITVINGKRERHDLIRKSNEAVLKARLEDAKFFWNEDVKIPLATWGEKLSGITWLEGQGTLTDKSARVKRLVGALGAKVGVASGSVEKAALLCKADLSTNMVREKEFNSLQGVMGGLYASAQGLGPEVASAISEHYRPRWAGDSLPETPGGALLSVSDKLDTIAGCFTAGLIPTGSQDPFALRRQALGVLLIVLKERWSVSLDELIQEALEGYGGGVDAKTQKDIGEFFLGRLQSVLEGKNLAYDVVNAVLAAPGGRLTERVEKAEAVHRMKNTEEFQTLATAAGRVLRILPDAPGVVEVSETLFAVPEESALWKALIAAEPGVKKSVQVGDWQAVAQGLGSLAPAVHGFFEKVLVMDKDPKVKDNRLALLGKAAGLFLNLCDFRKLVYASEKA
jgi:glycyl-tRNA synthetase beta chain